MKRQMSWYRHLTRMQAIRTTKRLHKAKNTLKRKEGRPRKNMLTQIPETNSNLLSERAIGSGESKNEKQSKLYKECVTLTITSLLNVLSTNPGIISYYILVESS